MGTQYFRYQLDVCPLCSEQSLLVTYRGVAPPGAQAATSWDPEAGECRHGCRVESTQLPAEPKVGVGRFLLHWRADT